MGDVSLEFKSIASGVTKRLEPWGKFEIFIPGIPQPQGSKDIHHHGNRSWITESNAKTLAPWRDKITVMTLGYTRGLPSRMLQMPLQMETLFILPRPKFHFGKNGLLSSAPPYPDVQPDLDKLLRALGDGLAKGKVMRIDSQIVCHLTTKLYGAKPGVHVLLQPYPAAFSVMTSYQTALELAGPDG